MTPINSVDHAYMAGIRNFSEALGYKAAFEAIEQAFLNASDATVRQAFNLEGGFFKELAELVAQYPNWNVRFFNTETGPAANISAIDVQQGLGEKLEIEDKIHALYAKYNKLPGLSEFVSALRLTDKKPEE